MSKSINGDQMAVLADLATLPNPVWPILAITGGFLIIFPVLWCLIVWIMSYVGGWQRLARRYAAGVRPVVGEQRSGFAGMAGVVTYRSVLTLHLNREGFFVEVMPLFRIGHPRLFIPWSEISAREPYWVLFWKAERLTIGRPPAATLTLPKDLLARYPISG